MEISSKTFIHLGAIILTGISAGLFYGWSVSVIVGTQKLSDIAYLQTMQSINREILNPWFFGVFFGSGILLSLSSFYHFGSDQWAFYAVLAAAFIYIMGTIGVTGLGNVPLNNELDVLKIPNQTTEQLATFRQYYETRWNRLHTIRTVWAMMAFLLSTLALIIHTKKI